MGEKVSVAGERASLVVPSLPTPTDLGRGRWGITSDEIISCMRSGKRVRWSSVPSPAILGVLQKASQEVQVPVSTFNITEFDRPLNMLGGHTLKGLYKNVKHRERGKKKPMPFLLESLGVRVTEEDFIAAIKQGRIVHWDLVPRETIKGVLEKVAQEQHKTASTLLKDDLLKQSELLEGKNLQRVYKYFRYHPDRKRKNIMIFLRESCGIEVTLYDRQSNGLGKFLAGASEDDMKELLAEAGRELKKPGSMLTLADLGHHFIFLNGRRLDRTIPDKYDITRRSFLNKSEITLGDVIEISRRGNLIPWRRIPMEVIRDILVKAAEESGVDISMISLQNIHFKFLGGKTLKGLSDYAYFHKDRLPQETSMMFIRRKLALPEVSRSAFRMRKIEEFFTEQTPLGELPKEIIIEALMPCIQSVAKLYADLSINIQKEEIESEAVIFISDAIKKGLSKDDLIKNLHEHLEGFRRREYQARYREKLLSTEIAEGLTLQDVIASRDSEVEFEEEGLSEGLREKLKVLTPFQQKLVIAFAVDGKNLDELAEELGLDRDVLEEHYLDALALLRNIMDTDDEG